MNPFSISGAWSFGIRFIADRPGGHALILIGIGILAPFLVQYAILGGTLAPLNPATMQSGMATGAAAGAPAVVAMALSYVLQTGSYFASWRLGFGAGRSLAGALLYGLAAGLLAVAVMAAVGVSAVWIGSRLVSPGAVILGALVVLVPIILVLALFYATLAALAAAAISLLLVVAMVLGTAIGQVGLAATMVGGRGDIVVLLLVMCGLLMWLAARLCCTTAAMADRGSFNLIAATRDSWRLTWEEQFGILRYLALVGFVLAVLLIGGAVAAGAGMASLVGEDSAPTLQTGAIVGRFLVGIPVAFLTVLVPAGIYRQLTHADLSAEVFA